MDENEPFYVSDDYEEEEFNYDEEDLELIDVELEDDFKTQGKERCTDKRLNISCNMEDIESDPEDYNVEVENEEEFGSEEEIDDTQPTNIRNLGSEAGKEFPIHDPSVKWSKMKPILGERYESPQQLKNYLTNYAIYKGYNIKFIKCDTVRFAARCGSKNDSTRCPFKIFASWMTEEKSFQVKTFVDKHKCVKKYKNEHLMNPTWLARHFLKELLMKPKLKVKEMQHMVKKKFYVEVCWSKCYRARCRAMSMIEGKLTDHYAKVWEYGQELRRSNPGSTVRVCVTEGQNKVTYFHRMYVCFQAIKEGWKVGCRRVIGLDGSFLKGQCKGELLTAIGRDANNQVYPIAWAVVEVENKVNWRWFLQLVRQDLSLAGGNGLTVISDQHKGLIEAIKEVLPYAEHRQCARHIYANFRKIYSGVEFKNMFWGAAFSTVEVEFERKMEEIKQINPKAYEHLMARNPHSWCRAFFKTGVACEAVENGIAECFNAIFVEARKKPLLAMLEEIRLYMMDRFYKMSQKAMKWESDVCPAATKKMAKFGEDIRTWYVNPSGPLVFEARNGYEGYAVDLKDHLCGCRLWQMSGIPCVHAQAAILHTGEDPAIFISDWFSKEKFQATYATNILPVNGSNMWPISKQPKPLPPLARRMPGRPSVKRKQHEMKM